MSPRRRHPVDRTMWTSLLHAGLAGSFMRFPHVRRTTDALREAGAGAAIYGIPFDATNISRTGANYGPRGMRDVSCQFLTYNAMFDFDVADALSPVDCGDCDVIPGDPARTFERAQADIEQILRAGALPVTLGGEHSVTIPAVRAVRAVHENPGLILVDTHLDTAPDVGGELLSHCCPITRAVDAGFDPTKIVLVGIRIAVEIIQPGRCGNDAILNSEQPPKSSLSALPCCGQVTSRSGNSSRSASRHKGSNRLQ